MSGETDLGRLIREMKPELHEGEYVFCSVSEVRLSVDIEPLCLFQEQEGITVIVLKQRAGDS